jgi:hypothetical protein
LAVFKPGGRGRLKCLTFPRAATTVQGMLGDPHAHQAEAAATTATATAGTTTSVTFPQVLSEAKRCSAMLYFCT